MIIDEMIGGRATERLRTTATYYAVELPRLLALIEQAGFMPIRAVGIDFYQPILIGRPTH